MYNSTGATIRHDINTYVLQAADTENLLIGQKVLPPLQVPTKAGIYPKIKIAKGGLLREDSSERASDGSYNEVSRAVEQDTYACQDRGLVERIDDAYATDMSRFFDANVTAAKLLLRNIMIGQEMRVASTVFNSSTFTTQNAAVGYTAGNLSTIDFAEDILTAIDYLTGVGQIPNTLVLNRGVFNLLRRSPKLQTYLFGNLPSGLQRIVQAQDIAGAFGLEQVLVADAKYDSSNAGQSSPNLNYIWSSDFVWLGKVAGGEFNAGGAGRITVWNADAPDLFVTETYRDEDRRSDMVRVRQNSDEKIVDETAGLLIVANP